ncbi:MAG: hypothetical protein JNL81_15080 [Hyphomonadaceae bacterium]|nr:hypothetical protein [Hyphomonadaceae bacterium]
MRIVLAAALMLAQVSVASAQTTPPVEETPAPTPETSAPSTCAEFPQEPAAIDHTRANPTQMSAASTRQREWRARMNEVIECRRLYYNAAIAHFNEVNGAWSTQLDAFCARSNIRCAPQDRAQE